MRTGGHTHAEFKGKREAEYTWFALSDSLPLVSTSAEHVARSLWRAVCDGDAEVVVGWPARVAVVLQNLFPNEMAEVMMLVNRLLPGPDRGRHDPGARREPDGDDPRPLEPARPAVHPAGLRLIGPEGTGFAPLHRLGWGRVVGSSLATSFPVPTRPRRARWPNRACQPY